MVDNSNDMPIVSPAWAVLYRRWTSPRKQWSFWTFLFVGIFLLGGLAFWVELYRYLLMPVAAGSHSDLGAVRLALATAGLAVGGPAAMQLLYSRDKLAIVFAIILFTVVTISAMFLMVFGEPAGLGTIVGGVMCLLPAILAWMLANGEDIIFQDEARDDAAGGGPPMRTLAPVTTQVKV